MLQYVIFAAPYSSKYSKLIDITGTNYTQEDLQDGTSYKYFVAAHDKNGKFLAFSKPIHIATSGGKKDNT